MSWINVDGWQGSRDVQFRDWRPVHAGPEVARGASPPALVTHMGELCYELELPAAAAKPNPGDGGHWIAWNMIDQLGLVPDWTDDGEPSVFMMRVREVGSSDLSAGHEYGLWFSNQSNPLSSSNHGWAFALHHTGGARAGRSHNIVSGASSATYSTVGAGIASLYGSYVANVHRQGGTDDALAVMINRGLTYGMNADETSAIGSGIPLSQAGMGGNGAPKVGVYLGHSGALAAPVTVRFVPEYALLRLPRYGQSL